MNDYTELDAAIVTRLSERAMGFNSIVSAVGGHAAPFAAKNDRVPAWRVVDRRLQALRKAGKIAYGGPKTGWTAR